MNGKTDSLSSDPLKPQDVGFSTVKGITLGALIGFGTSIAATSVAYATGYKYYHNCMKAWHDGVFDMYFDMAAGGLFGGAMQYWNAKRWNEALGGKQGRGR